MEDSGQIEQRQYAASLVGRIQGGEGPAEAEMIGHFSRGLRFLLRRKTRNPELAEDLLQETWTIALAKLRSTGLDQPEKLAGYLCGIARNLASSEQRRVQRQRTSIDTEIVELVPDPSESPFSQTSRAEICRHVRELLEELSQERDKEILKRFYVQEEPKDQICRDLSVDSTHFNRVLFRARQRLKDVVMRAEMRNRLTVVG